MIELYRPQFAYQTPDGCREEDFIYVFDGTNTPALNQNLNNVNFAPPNAIPLNLDQDVPFLWRGIKIGPMRETTSGTPVAYLLPNISVQFRDPYNNDLSIGLVPATHYGFPQNPVTYNSGLYGGNPVPIDEIYCPPGGVVQLFLSAGALGSLPLQFFLSVSLHGVKRYRECKA